jgi:nucleotide-binding universal stress UspA family protein
MNQPIANSKPAAPLPTPAHYRVLVGWDFSALGDRAVLEGLSISTQHPRAELHVITVGAEAPGGLILPGPLSQVRSAIDARELARARVGQLSDSYFAGHPCVGLDKIAVYTTVGSPAERIVALASALDADIIVLGTHGRRGVDRMVLGSVAEAVVRRAPCGVFVLRPRDFLDGERLPAIQPPLLPGEHPLLPFRESVTYHYVDRLTQGTERLMPVV